MNRRPTVQEIIEAKSVLQSLLEKSFSAKTAFKIINLIKGLTGIEQVFNEVKINTIKKYGKKDENGEIITEKLEDGQVYIPIQEEFQQQCSEEILEALNQRVDISFIPLTIEELDSLTLLGKEALALHPFLLYEEDSE